MHQDWSLFNEKTKPLTTEDTRSTPSRCSVAQGRLWNTEESKIAGNRAKSPKARVIGKGKTWPPQIAQIKTFNHRDGMNKVQVLRRYAPGGRNLGQTGCRLCSCSEAVRPRHGD